MDAATPERGLLSGGEWRRPPSLPWIDVRAERAFARGSLTPSRRSEVLRGAAARIRARNDELARLVALESGKPLREARGKVGRTAAVLEEAAEEARRISGQMVAVDAVPSSEDRTAFTIRLPLGIVGPSHRSTGRFCRPPTRWARRSPRAMWLC